MKLLKLIAGILVLALFASSCLITSLIEETKLPVDVPAVTLTSNYSLNGEPFSASQYEKAFFSLRNPDSGDTVALGDSNDQSHSTLVIPGVYDVIYTYTRGSEVPQNQDAIVKAAVAIQADQVLDIDVSSVEIRPLFTLNGKPFPTSVYNRAEFYLEEVSGGERIPLGNSHQANEPIVILPGIYNVIYSHQNGDLVPQNPEAIVMSGVDISSSSRALVIDVPAVTLKSTYSLNGEPFPVSHYERAIFSLRNPDSGDTVELGWCYDQYHSTMIISGVYDVVYAYTQGATIPQNQDAVVMSDVDISSRRGLPIDVPAVTLTSSYRLNGEPFPLSIYHSAFFSLRNPDSGDTVELGDSNDQSHSTLVIPGVYDVVYTYIRGWVPYNQDAVVMSDVDIGSNQALAIDVPAVTLTGGYRLNGEPFSESIYHSAFFSLRNPDSGDTVELGDSNDQSYSTLVIPGVYDVVYAHRQGSVPQNQDAIFRAAVVIQADQVLDIDVSSVEITPHLTLNGEPFPTSIYHSAKFYLADISGDGRIPLGNSHQASEPVVILPGIYKVIYSHQNGDLVPQNQDAIVMSSVDISSSQALAIDVRAVSGTNSDNKLDR